MCVKIKYLYAYVRYKIMKVAPWVAGETNTFSVNFLNLPLEV